MAAVALVVTSAAVAACDAPQEPVAENRVGAADLDLVQGPVDLPHPSDCRDAYYCYGSCQGGAWLEGAAASEQHDDCAELCEPSNLESAHHFDWWLDALEVECAEDASNECWWSAISLDQGGHELALITLDGCMREGASW